MRLPLLVLLSTFSLTPTLLAQAAATPVSVIEVGPFALGPRFSAYLTPEGRVLLHEFLCEPGEIPQQAIWEGRSGMLVRHTLRPLTEVLESGHSEWSGCGLGLQPAPTTWTNQTPNTWNPLTRRFQLESFTSEPVQELDEEGGLHEASAQTTSPSSQIAVIAPNHLRVEGPDGSRWEVSQPWVIPAETQLTPMQRLISRDLGFRDALADRAGEWLVAVWTGAVASSTPRGLSFIPAPVPRWQLWRRGQSDPVMNVPLAFILGPGANVKSMSLNGEGDRIVITTDRGVLAFDPKAQRVVLHRPGRLEALLPECNRIILAQGAEGGTRMLSLDLESGQKVGELVVPESLDPEPASVRAESAAPSDLRRRPLLGPVAFSPDGRTFLTPRADTHDWHWDGLVLWEFPQP